LGIPGHNLVKFGCDVDGYNQIMVT